jgi:phosphoglycolate phosphatase-like HAD superfamily hydrolase
MDRFQLSQLQMLVVGDHRPDILMARNAGVKSVYCNYGFFGNDEIGADYSIDSFSELLDIIEKWIETSAV